MSKLKYLSLFLILPFLQSCSNSEIVKVPLFDCSFVVNEIEGQERYYALNLETDDIEELIEKKADFLLYVFVPGCGTCETFPITLNGYLKENQVVINYCLLGAYSRVDASLPSLDGSSFVFFNDGKVSEVLDLNDYALDSEGFASMMDEYTYQTGVEIINPVYIESYFSNYYANFVFEDLLAEQPETGYFYQNDIEEIKKDSTLLLVDEDAVSDFTQLTTALNDSTFDKIAFISDDLKEDEEALKSYLGIEEIGTYTLISYLNGEAISITSDSSLSFILQDDFI